MMAHALADVAIGILLIYFSHEIATELNRLSVKVHEVFPRLKDILPGLQLAGTSRNYKSSLYFFRFVGAFMVLFGTFFLGLVVLHYR